MRHVYASIFERKYAILSVITKHCNDQKFIADQLTIVAFNTDVNAVKALLPSVKDASMALVSASLIEDPTILMLIMSQGACDPSKALIASVQSLKIFSVKLLLSYPQTDPSCQKNAPLMTALEKSDLEIAKLILNHQKFQRTSAVELALKEKGLGLFKDSLFGKSVFKYRSCMEKFKNGPLKDYMSDFSVDFDYSETLLASINSAGHVGKEERAILVSFFDNHTLMLGSGFKYHVDLSDYANLVGFFEKLFHNVSTKLALDRESKPDEAPLEEARKELAKDIANEQKMKRCMELYHKYTADFDSSNYSSEWAQYFSEHSKQFLPHAISTMEIFIQLSNCANFPDDERAKRYYIERIKELSALIRDLPINETMLIPLLGGDHAVMASFTRTSADAGTYRVYNTGDGTLIVDDNGRIPAWEEFYNVPGERIVKIVEDVIKLGSIEKFRKVVYPEGEFESAVSDLRVVPQRSGSCTASSIWLYTLVTLGRPMYMIFKTISLLTILDQIYTSLSPTGGKILIGEPFNYEFEPNARAAFVFARQTKMFEKSLIKKLDQMEGKEKDYCMRLINKHLEKHEKND
jgi:hypothetical protein